jgi:two-component system cell cycle sensor histidine kinase/response regulator CckA
MASSSLSEAFLRKALEAAGVGVWSWNVVSGEVLWSEAVYRLFGVDRASYGGTLAEYEAMIHPEDRNRHMARVQEALEQRSKDFRSEHRVVRRDGQVVLIEARGEVECGEDGRPQVMRGIALDVTEPQRLRDQLIHAQKMESIGRLAGGVAHDFNNILTTVIGFAEIARQDLPEGSAAASSVAKISEAAQRGGSLTRQLLMFARRQKSVPILLDLDDLLARMEPLLRGLLGEDVSLKRRSAGDSVIVKADPGQIEQVIVNLVVNARDAMPSGGKLDLELRVESVGVGSLLGRQGLSPGPWALLSVSDSGTGMTPEVKARIFEPFFTTKPVGRGSGLGLATCYGIIAQTGGRILVDSEPGKGSRFRVCLPVAPDADGAGKTPLPSGASLKGTETLLFVEDDSGVREMVVDLLEKSGYRVLSADEGESALKVLSAHGGDVDLLVSDVVMPVMGGRELWDRLRDRIPGLKVLFTSGYTEDLAVQAKDKGRRQSFLPKPYTPVDLLSRVRAMLDAGKAT